jgi:hypothetical protein
LGSLSLQLLLVSPLPNDLEGEARFALTSRASEGEQAHIRAQEQLLGSLSLLLAANQGGQKDSEGMHDKRSFVPWRRFGKDGEMVLHLQFLLVSSAIKRPEQK